MLRVVCGWLPRRSATVYGTAREGDGQRVNHFVDEFYLGAYGGFPDAALRQQQAQRLNDAAALGPDKVKAEARLMGAEIFRATNYNGTHSDSQYVTDLYEAFLQRAPDGPGMSFWLSKVRGEGRASALDGFKASKEYEELADTLYRETFWLVSDQLGTPRMVVDKLGTLAGIKRHDYLPFGEELPAGTRGRTTTQGYSQDDNVRQNFTGYERDVGTSLDYARARYFSRAQGRFIGVDPGPFTPADPQNWNRYAYVQNNPLKFVDPTGRTLSLTGDDADELLRALELGTGYKLIRDAKTGNVTIDGSVKRNKAGTSKHLAGMLKQVINDSQTLQLHTETPAADVPHAFIDGGIGAGRNGYMDRAAKTVYMDDYRSAKAKDQRFATTLLGHVLDEGYGFMQRNLHDQYLREEPHDLARNFESQVLSDLTGRKEQTRVNEPIPGGGVRFIYTSVTYDVYHKQFGPEVLNTIILVNEKNCGCKR